jgi:hypothetical protein
MTRRTARISLRALGIALLVVVGALWAKELLMGWTLSRLAVSDWFLDWRWC